MKKLTRLQLSKIKQIAEKVYDRTQKYAYRFMYHPNLMGMCGVASGWASDELHKIKIKHKIILVNDTQSGFGNHVFLLINNEYILDITYRQFNKNRGKYKLISIDKSLKLNNWFWNLDDNVKFNTKTSLIKKQTKDRWYPEQIAL